MGDALNPCPYIAEKIFKEIAENPPAVAAKGGMINSGISAELDELRKISHERKRISGTAAAKRSRNNRYHFSEDRIQQCVWLLPGSNQLCIKIKCRRMDAQTNTGQCGTIYHTGIKRI